MTTMCTICACEVRTDDELCAICRRFSRNPEPLEGGYWERDGLVMRWVQVTPVREGGPPCGTDAGYEAHRRHGEQTCDECRAAHAVKRAAHRSHERDAA